VSEPDELDAAQRQAEYDRLARILWTCAALRDRHTAQTPECGGEPLCVGEDAFAVLADACRRSPGAARWINLAAVGELSRVRGELLAGMDELADVSAKAMRLDADLVDAHGEIDDMRERLDAAEAELERWNAAADVIGPVGQIGGEGS
jgi:hypothetical protein